MSAVTFETMPTLSEYSGPTLSPRFWLTVLIVGLAFFLTEHDTAVSKAEAYTGTADQMEASAQGGNSIRRLAFIVLAGWGVLRLFHQNRQFAGSGSSVSGNFLCLAGICFVGWCCMSSLWSADMGMTLRRCIVLVCFVLGAIGVSKHLSGREIVWLAVLIPLGCLLVGVLAELRHGTFRPWASDYRFSGSLHPNTQGLYLTSLCLGSFCLARSTPRHRLFLYSCFALGFLFLLLTKSRTSCAGMLVSLTPLWLLKTSMRSKLLIGVGAAWCVSLAALVLLLGGSDPQEEVTQMALLGREEQASSLTGRFPIWEAILPHIGASLLTGHGYDSFWTPETIDDVSSELHWGIREAHSAYFDTLLSIGLIGAGLLLAVILLGMLKSARLYLRTSRPVYGFVFGLLLFGLINGLTESGMTMPLFVPFVATTGLAFVGLMTPTRFDDEFADERPLLARPVIIEQSLHGQTESVSRALDMSQNAVMWSSRR